MLDRRGFHPLADIGDSFLFRCSIALEQLSVVNRNDLDFVRSDGFGNHPFRRRHGSAFFRDDDLSVFREVFPHVESQSVCFIKPSF